jgi:hypothetical protein
MRVLAAIFAVQFLIYLMGAISCVWFAVKMPGIPQKPICPTFADKLQRTFETALTTVLALMNGQQVPPGP